jgi:hypothetical protein
MTWMRLQAVVLAAALGVANAQCVITCAITPFHDDSSPCHHHPSKQTNDRYNCTHHVFVAEGQSVATACDRPLHPDRAMTGIARQTCGVALQVTIRVAVISASPPFHDLADYFRVLRI